jgi:ApbE superfamily uncharacterized protein (UPF0280 family)
VTGPQFGTLADGRRHFHHGPIDLVIEAFGSPDAIAAGYAAAAARFATVLEELVAELGLLRQPLGLPLLPRPSDFRRFAETPAGRGSNLPPTVEGPVARRMVAACWPYRDRFITPMAAVAGAVADEVLAVMLAAGPLDRAYVNNGGDIAVYLAAGQRFEIGVADSPDRPELAGRIVLAAGDGIGGIATSGRGGRSFSMGIADAVTVLARDAAAADAAATMIANDVDIDHSSVRRAPASALKDDTDLGDLLVTTGLGPLPLPEVERALDRGEARARALAGSGLIAGAVLLLRGRSRVVGQITHKVAQKIAA